MSTDIINEDDNKGYKLTRYWGGFKKGRMYQITQNYEKPYSDDNISCRFTGYVSLSKKDIEYILKKIKEVK